MGGLIGETVRTILFQYEADMKGLYALDVNTKLWGDVTGAPLTPEVVNAANIELYETVSGSVVLQMYTMEENVEVTMVREFDHYVPRSPRSAPFTYRTTPDARIQFEREGSAIVTALCERTALDWEFTFQGKETPLTLQSFAEFWEHASQVQRDLGVTWSGDRVGNATITEL